MAPSGMATAIVVAILGLSSSLKVIDGSTLDSSLAGRNRRFDLAPMPRSEEDFDGRWPASSRGADHEAFMASAVRVLPAAGVARKAKRREVNRAHLANELNGTTVTVQLGGSAQLRCPFGGTSDETVETTAISNGASSNDTYPDEGVVSWIRRKDMHPLTVGLTVYSSDKRFHPVKTRHSPEWRLEITKVREDDAGTYECLLSTEPPQSIFIHLRVVEAEAVIPGGPDIYLRAGSVLKLRCDLVKSTEAPEFVFWYRGDRMVNYDFKSHKHKIIVDMVDAKTSVLSIPTITKQDSGNFTCVPANAKPASVMVHVLDGEKPAAMQHEATSGAAEKYATRLAIYTALFSAVLVQSSLMIAR